MSNWVRKATQVLFEQEVVEMKSVKLYVTDEVKWARFSFNWRSRSRNWKRDNKLSKEVLACLYREYVPLCYVHHITRYSKGSDLESYLKYVCLSDSPLNSSNNGNRWIWLISTTTVFYRSLMNFQSTTYIIWHNVVALFELQWSLLFRLENGEDDICNACITWRHMIGRWKLLWGSICEDWEACVSTMSSS